MNLPPSSSDDPGELPTIRGVGRRLSVPVPDDKQPPNQTLSHYRLLEPLGSGGFGTVWRAQDERLLREVALKVLPSHLAAEPAALALLEAEARTVAGLDHPGIVTLHALEEGDGSLFLVMELIRGRTLAKVIPPSGLPVQEALDLALQLAEAVEAFHTAGVVHRDLNPRNLMVTPEGRLKVLDFGLALKLAAGLSPVLPNSDYALAGTLPYMSPEQVLGELVDPRTDLYSLGVVLFEMLTGRQPFKAPSIPELMKLILKQEIDLPASLPAALTALLRRCLAKSREARFQTCRALRLSLEVLCAPTTLRHPEGPSVAVLPFTDLSSQGSEDHFCEGMAESISDTLQRIPGLRLASRTSAFLFKDSRLDAREIGHRLGVSALLTGRVRKERGWLSAEVELVEAASGFRLWSQSYERDSQEVFTLQQEMALGVASALNLTLLPESRPRTSVDLEAYEDYLRGRQYYFRYNRHGMRFAMQMFQQALDRDSGFAAAWAGLANCAAFLYIYADRSETHRERAESASRRALELDPDLAEAWASRGVADSAAGRNAKADEAFEKALQHNPSLFEANYLFARHCFATGRLDRAKELFESAAALYPEDCQAPLLVAQVYASQGRPEEAAASRLKGLSRAEERLRRVPDDVRTRYLGANALVALGEREKGLAWARMARALDPEDPMLLYNLGCIHALAHDTDEALECLEQAVRAGLSQKGWFLNDGDLNAIRSHPRFQALVETLS